MKINFLLSSLSVIAMMSTACNDFDTDSSSDASGVIRASIDAPIQAENSRTAVDGDPSAGVVGIVWTDGDELGVFDNKGGQHTRYVKLTPGSVAEAQFGSSTGSSFLPKYAYYPYSADNDGRDITSLKGSLPAEQSVGLGNINGDYKIGRLNENTGKFAFAHLFSLVRVDLDATGTVLAGDELEYVKVTSDNYYLAGDFSFNLRRVTYSGVTNGSSSITVKWPEGTRLDSEISDYVSVFPGISAGSQLDFEIKTANYTATFTATSKVSFLKEHLYNFPIRLENIHKNYTVTVTDKTGKTVDLIKNDTPVIPLTGTFTCATYNVDGLPSTINRDGPGKAGTTLLGQTISSRNNWDFFGVSENFEYNAQLWNEISGLYDQGTYRKATLGLGTADTDGLNFFWKKDGIKAGNETIVEYTSKNGGLFDGANTSVKKGFRYYVVTLADGTELDVYITHMNTYSSKGTGHINAQHSQLEQLRNYVLDNAKKNNRPAIIMGDTNLRYTRHKIKELLIDAINSDENLEIIDPWVSLAWNNDFSSVGGDSYPLYPGKSLMVSDATGTDASTDIIISEAEGGLQKGEVVDKIFYINNRNSKTQIKAKSYLRDISFKKTDGSALADHYPIVVEFTYTTEK